MKKTVYFLLRRLFFSTWRPSQNNVFYDTKATFSFSVFSYFFLNIIEKSAPKFKPRFFPQKSLKSRPRKPFWGPKWFQIHVGKLNKAENSARKSFLDRAVFFKHFLRSKKLWSEPGWKTPSPAGRPQTLKTNSEDLRRSEEIWGDLELDIWDKSFPPAPPCPQTPKLPNHQDTGNLKLFPHARPLKGRRI